MSFKKNFNHRSIYRGLRRLLHQSLLAAHFDQSCAARLGTSSKAFYIKSLTPKLLILAYRPFGSGSTALAWWPSPLARFRSLGTSGFTLLEILIAIGILAVVATLVYASFDATIKVIDGVDHEANIYRDARLILTKLSEDLSMAYVPKGLQEATFVGQDGQVEDRAQDSLEFTALSHIRVVPDQPTSDLNLIEYTLEADSEGKDWTLVRGENANLYSFFREGGQYAIGEGIRGFNLRYFDGKTWADSWDSTIQKGLPWVVEIEIQFQEPRGGQRSFKSWVELALAK
jgi:general secretion pathway protein J